MHDRPRTRREPGRSDTIRVEDVIPADILNDTRVDREYLEQVFREPQKFVPPRVRHEPAPLPEEPQPEPESRFARRAKFGALLVAAALVTGSIIAAAMLTGQHRSQAPAPASGTNEIGGAAALGGFAVPAPGSSTTKGSKAAASGDGKTVKIAPAAQTESVPSKAAEPSSAPTRPAIAAQTAPAQQKKIDLVKTFYSMIGLDPQAALSLLTPLLNGDQTGDLVRAWSSMNAIKVQDAVVQPDGSILAVVTLLQPDGVYLRVTQLLRLADGPSGLISEVRLLSAQRM